MFCCNPQLHPKLMFYRWFSLKDKNIDVDQKHNLKKNKDTKRFERQSKQEPPQTRD